MNDDAQRSGNSLTVQSKIWIERREAVVLSDWRVQLLEAVEAEGSLSRAAELMDVPYRTAWNRIKESETALGVRLLETETGGATGGGSRLTPEGRDLIQRFRRMADGLQEIVANRFAAEFGQFS